MCPEFREVGLLESGHGLVAAGVAVGLTAIAGALMCPVTLNCLG